MNEQITEHVSYDRGYTKGIKHGRKQTWDLVQKHIEWIQQYMKIVDEKDPKYDYLEGQYHALLYTQMSIKTGRV